MTSDGPATELWRKIWKEWIQAWLDIRQYLRQRQLVLQHPDLSFPETATANAEWKTPLAFAIQGTVLTAFIVGLIGNGFSWLIAERPTVVFRVEMNSGTASLVPQLVPGGSAWDSKRKIIEADLRVLRGQLEKIDQAGPGTRFQGPVPYSQRDNPTVFALGVALAMSEMSKAEAAAAYRGEIVALERERRFAKLAPNIEKAQKAIQTVLLPLSLVLAAYIFRILARVGARAHRAPLVPAHIAYLYYVTASLFWVNITFAVILAIQTNVAKYFPPQMSQIVADLGAALSKKWTTGQLWQSGIRIALIGAAIWGYMNVRAIARRLRAPLGLEAAKSRWQFYTGEAKIRKDLLLSNGLAVIVLSLFGAAAVFGYALVAEWVAGLKI
jgi:hypothetical protein